MELCEQPLFCEALQQTKCERRTANSATREAQCGACDMAPGGRWNTMEKPVQQARAKSVQTLALLPRLRRKPIAIGLPLL